MEFRITATSGFADVLDKLRDNGHLVYDLDSEDLPLEGYIEIKTIEDLYYLGQELGEELIITSKYDVPGIEVYNDYRE